MKPGITSHTRLDGYVKTLSEDWGVKMFDTIEAMLPEVDGVLLGAASDPVASGQRELDARAAGLGDVDEDAAVGFGVHGTRLRPNRGCD